nr:DEAD-box ATP-dependent RNA helicase 5 [Tanacetum cinerariifolium]
MLQRRGWKVVSISGDKAQRARTEALQLFKEGTSPLLENKGLSGELINVLREAGQNVPTNLLNFGTHVKKKESKLYGAHFKEISADAPKATKITFGSDDEED